MSDNLDSPEMGIGAPTQSWFARGACLTFVLLVHLGLVLLLRSTQVIDSPGRDFVTSDWVDILPATTPPRPEAKAIAPNIDLQLEAPPPPIVPLQEFVIETASASTETNSAPQAFVPSPAASGSGAQSSTAGGGAGEGLRGDGIGAGGSSFTNCREVKAVYPEKSELYNEQGKVVLMGELNEQGVIESITVASSSGFRLLDESAVAALKRWKCQPVIENGRPVRARGLQEFNFSITTIR